MRYARSDNPNSGIGYRKRICMEKRAPTPARSIARAECDSKGWSKSRFKKLSLHERIIRGRDYSLAETRKDSRQHHRRLDRCFIMTSGDNEQPGSQRCNETTRTAAKRSSCIKRGRTQSSPRVREKRGAISSPWLYMDARAAQRKIRPLDEHWEQGKITRVRSGWRRSASALSGPVNERYCLAAHRLPPVS